MMEHSNLLTEQGMYEIYDLWHTPWWQTRLFYAGVGFIFVAVVTYTIIRLVAYYRLKARYKYPWDIALIELQALAHSRLDSIEECKRCYERLCWILKKYLTLRFHTAFEGRTEEEVITMLNAAGVMPAHQIHELEEIFQGGTLVKFANLSVLREHVMHDIDRSIRLVLATRPAQ